MTAESRPLLAGDPGHLARAAPDDAAESPRAGSAFCGRMRQLEEIHNAFRQTARGDGVAVFVRGERGMGKTALLREIVTQLRQENQNLLPLSARCPRGDDVPFKAIAGILQQLESHLATLPEWERSALTPRDLRGLARAFPELHRLLQPPSALAHAPAADLYALEQRTRLFAAVRQLFAQLAGRYSVVVAIDDLHCSDADSRALLGELLRAPRPPPVLLIATVCPRDADWLPDGSDSMTRFADDVRWVELGPLGRRSAQDMAAKLLRSVDPGRRADERSLAVIPGGPPRLIHELVCSRMAAHSATGLPSMDSLLRARVAAVSPEARQVLDLLALIEAPVSLQALAGAAAKSSDAIARTVVQLSSAGLVEQSPHTMTSVIEPLFLELRDVLLSSLPPDRRAGLHAAWAEALEKAEGARLQPISAHWRASGAQRRAFESTRGAAYEAKQVTAADNASRLYRRLLELSPADPVDRLELQICLGETLATCGRPGEAAETYLGAVEKTSGSLRVGLLRKAAEQHMRNARVDESLAAIRELLALVGLHFPRSPRRALVEYIRDQVKLRIRGLRYQPVDATELSRDEIARLDACWSVSIELANVETIVAMAFQAQGLLELLRAGEPTFLTRQLALEASLVGMSGGARARKRTGALIAAAHDAANESQQPAAFGCAAIGEGGAAYSRGSFWEARSHLELAQRVFRESHDDATLELDTLQLFLGYSMYYLGELAEFEQHVSSLLREADDRGNLHAGANLRSGPCNSIWLMRDVPERALAETTEALSHWEGSRFLTSHWLAFFARTQAHLYSGRADAAWAHVVTTWPDLRRSLLLHVKLVNIEALCLRARTAIAAAEVNAATAPALIRQARRDLRSLRRQRAHWALPLIHLLRAGLLHCEGKKQRSLAELGAAEETGDAADMALHTTVARYRRGQLLGGEEGEGLRSAAETWMRGQRVSNPARLVSLLAPGFADLD